MIQNVCEQTTNKITTELDRKEIRRFFDDKVSDFNKICPVLYWGVRVTFYRFDREDFFSRVERESNDLRPLKGAIPAKALNTGFLSLNIQWELVYNEALSQHSLLIRGHNAGILIDVLERMKSAISRFAEKDGSYPFYAPKIDGLAPNGMDFILEINKDFPDETLNRGLTAAAGLSRELAAIPCCHVNSYKRLTPKNVIPGWDIPYKRSVSTDWDPNAILWSDKKATHTVVFRQADCWADPFLVLTSYLSMLQAGFENEDIQYEPAPPVMPNSLGAAMKLWNNSPFARKHFSFIHEKLYEAVKKEWFEYCDIAHPWELLRGHRE